MAETYQKINAMYCRYQFDGKTCPKKEWLPMKNKIIIGKFSMKEAEYLFNNPWIGESKIDGTNSKIMYFPSNGKIEVGGKSDKANSIHGQFEMLEEIGKRIQPILAKMFPKESAKFAPLKDKETNKVIYHKLSPFGKLDENVVPTCDGDFVTELIELPIYIYGEYYGNGVQKCGKSYSKDNKFAVFDIKVGGWWMPIEKRNEVCKELGLERVPTLGLMTLQEAEAIVRNGFATKVKDSEDESLIEEGIVLRTPLNLKNDSGNRLIVKIKHCDYVDYDKARATLGEEEFKAFEKWYYEEGEIKV